MLFRIAQEALHNVIRHSQATEATVQFKLVNQHIYLKISDNGRGFKVSDELSDFTNTTKLGLLGIQERARLFDADLSIQSNPDKGTSIIVSLNVPA
jgi:signal transduction histidine kinase